MNLLIFTVKNAYVYKMQMKLKQKSKVAWKGLSSQGDVKSSRLLYSAHFLLDKHLKNNSEITMVVD